ncbi:N-acetyltransferase 9 [Aphelenchoides besseyi]|nr:N-acetyltransferase 9 [Aphelenchoides besseyi]KAI6202514.1 N-acetyltransferase 9 [Aphelenchoides besseyi]
MSILHTNSEWTERLKELCASNSDIAYANEKVVLITYESRHVERYHTWMSDDETREMTCSERLSLEEEHETRANWAQHQYCGTFLIIDAEEFVKSNGSEEDSLAGDVNFVQYFDYVELLIMIGDRKFRRRRLADQAVRLMIGHVSAFVNNRNIQANIRADNKPCIKLLKRVGFTVKEDSESTTKEDVIMVVNSEEQKRIANEIKNVLYRDNNLIQKLIEGSREYAAQFV